MTATLTHQDWQGRAARLDIATGLFIDGQSVAALAGETFDCVNPATGALLARVARGQAADVGRAVASCLAAWRDGRWAGQAPRARAAVLLKWADLVEAHSEELALLETLDMGKPISDMFNIDLPEVLKTIRYFAECVDKIEGSVTHTDASALHTITHEPLGVVGAITPWNYPMLMAVWKLAPILAAGNCVVLKPAEQSPLTCIRLAQLFVDAGGPAGVFNVVNGMGAEAGKTLALHMDVDKITFTGSTAVGKLLLGYAGQSNMKRVALETGGKSPQIFMPDLYDFDAAVDRAIGGIFDNAGQVCNAGSRLLVHRSIHDRFVARFVERASALYQAGDPLEPATTMGPLVSQTQRANVQARIARALEQGARQVLPALGAGLNPAGAYVAPTLFTHVRQDMKKCSGQKPNHRLLLEHGPHSHLDVTHRHGLFQVGQQPHTERDGHQTQHRPSRKMLHAKMLKPSTCRKHRDQKSERAKQAHPAISLGIKRAPLTHQMGHGGFTHGHHGAGVGKHDQQHQAQGCGF